MSLSQDITNLVTATNNLTTAANNVISTAVTKDNLLSEIQAVDGSGSGLDADLLDGLDSTAFAKTDGDNTQTFKVADAVNDDEALSKGQLLSEIQAVDGAGSGLDADTVDGIQSNLLGIGGAGYAWVDETSNRTAGTTYTNTTGKPIMVSCTAGGGSNAYINLFVNNMLVSRNGNTAGNGMKADAQAIVPNGSTYKVELIHGSLTWYELK